MKKRILSLVFSVIMVISLVPSLTAYAVPQAYWPIQADYLAAVDSNNDDGIISAVERLNALFPNPSSVDEANMTAWPLQKAAAIYEKRGQFAKAAETYRKFLSLVEYLDENGTDYYDLIRATESLLDHCSVAPAVYTVTEDIVSYHGAKNEPERGTFFGKCKEDGASSAFLLYANFGTESFETYSYLIPDDKKVQILEFAWNIGDETFESLRDIADGRYDDYIRDNVRFMSTLDRPVLLRFAAEANCWGDLSGSKGGDALRKADAETFISAFRHVASIAHSMAGNVAMVFSPNDISNWYMTAEDFYPGDEYVDWVGISTYMEYNAGSSSYGNGNDAFYARGFYDSQIVKIKPIIDAFGDKKPIMISECGFRYNGGSKNESYAAKKVREFYSYVNMVYPEVKTVFYFDHGDYILSGCPSVKYAYNNAVDNNLPMRSTLYGPTVSYCKLDDYRSSTDSLHLYTYADCPGENIKVTYTLNGQQLPSSSEAPYDCTVNASSLSAAKNALVVKVTQGADEYELKYTLNLSGGRITVSGYAPIEQPSPWAAGEVGQAISLGLVPDELQSGYTKGISRGALSKMLSIILDKAYGGTPADTSASFVDTSDADVLKAANLGIINGYRQEDGSYRFKPDNTLKRCEMTAVVNRVARLCGQSVDGFDGEVRFTDTRDHWCGKELGWAVHNGIVKGTTDTTFSPENTLTVEQTIIMVYRLYSAVVGD